MTHLMKMRYKDFEFTSNPENIEIKYQNNISKTELFGSDSGVQNVSRNPCVVNASGSFFGSEGTELTARLEAIYKDKRAGYLFLPNGGCFRAFLSSFSYEINASRSAVLYSLEFTEDCRHIEARYDFGFTYALSGENAFHIAKRTGVPVESIMAMNDFKDAFDISEGERVALQ